jgi:hypothetical protein
MQHYPKWLYHESKPARIVNDADEHAEHEEKGWVDTPAKLKKADVEEDADAGVDKTELIAQAKALGIDAKGTWGVKKLQEAIAAELDRE